MKRYLAIERRRFVSGQSKTDTIGNGFATDVFDSYEEAGKRIKELEKAVYVPEEGEICRPSYRIIPFEHYPPTGW